MSTRACYGFQDEHATHWVYVHHDGYPTGAARKLKACLESDMHWPLPRFEADEFAAAFVATTKEEAGGVRLTTGPDAHGDLEWTYLVRWQGYPNPPRTAFPFPPGQLMVQVTDMYDRTNPRPECPLADFLDAPERLEAKR